MSFDWASVVLTTVISGSVNVAIWFLFKRQIDRQDQKLHDQSMELRELREKRVTAVEEFQKETMTRAACAAMHHLLEKRLDQGTDDFRTIRDDISIMRASIERIGGLLDHVLKNMGLHMIGDKVR